MNNSEKGEDISNETNDLFLNEIYSLGLVFLRISSLDVKKSTVTPKVIYKPNIKTNLASLIEYYPVCLKTDNLSEFKDCQKNEYTIDFDGFDHVLNPLIRETTEKNYLPRTLGILKRNGFDIQNTETVTENVDIYSFDYKYEEKNLDATNREESFEFQGKGKEIFKAIRKFSTKDEEKNQTQYIYKEVNILSLMLEPNPEKRYNIFEILLIIQGKNRYQFPKNPMKSKEIVKIGLNGNIALNFIGNSLKNGDLVISTFNMTGTQHEISFKKIWKEINENERNILETIITVKNSGFHDNPGVYVIKMNTIDELALVKSKTLKTNKRIIILEFPNVWESAEICKIALKSLAKFLENDLIFSKKIKFTLHYNNQVLEEIQYATIAINDLREKKNLIQIMVYKNEAMSREVFLSQIANFLRIMKKKTPFLQEFNNKAIFGNESLNLWFNTLMLNFIRFDALPHIFFDQYHIADILGNKSFRTYSFQGTNNAIYLDEFSEVPFYEVTQPFDYFLRFTCEEQFADDVFDEENLETHDDVTLFLEMNKIPGMYEKIKEIHIHGQTDFLSKNLCHLVKKCINLENLEFEFIDSFDSQVDESFLMEIISSISKLKKLNLGNINVSDKFLELLTKNAKILQHLKVLDISESRNIKAEKTLINFFENDGVKLKKLDISSLSCINDNVLKAFLQSNLRFYLKELKLGQTREKIDNILLFIQGILSDKEVQLESLFFKNVFGISQFKKNEILQIQDLIEKREKYLYVDICEIKPEILMKISLLKNSKEIIWDKQMLNEMLSELKNCEFNENTLRKLFQTQSYLIFQNVNFDQIIDFHLVNQNQFTFSHGISSLELRNCVFSLEIWNQMIIQNFHSKTLKIDPKDIKESKKCVFSDFLALFIKSRRCLVLNKIDQVIEFIFQGDSFHFQINIYDLMMSPYSIEELAELFSLNTQNKNFLNEVKLFYEMAFDFSVAKICLNSKETENIIQNSLIDNENVVKVKIVGDFEIIFCSFKKDFSNLYVKKLNISITSMNAPLENIAFLLEKISKIFCNLEIIELFLDFDLKEKEPNLLIGEVRKIITFYLEKSLFFKIILTVKEKFCTWSSIKSSIDFLKYEKTYRIIRKNLFDKSLVSLVLKKI